MRKGFKIQWYVYDTKLKGFKWKDYRSFYSQEECDKVFNFIMKQAPATKYRLDYA